MRKEVCIITKIWLAQSFFADYARPHYFSCVCDPALLHNTRTFYGRVDAQRGDVYKSLSLPFRSHIFTSDPREKKQNHLLWHGNYPQSTLFEPAYSHSSLRADFQYIMLFSRAINNRRLHANVLTCDNNIA